MQNSDGIPELRPRGHLWKSLLVAVVSLAVAAVLGEAVIRLVYGQKFGKRPGFYVGDDVLGWRPAPNLDHTFYGPDYSIRVVTDGEGYRLGAGGEVDFTRKLIVLSGDSFTFGWGVSTDETYASYLDLGIDSLSAGTTRVVNLGVGAYGLYQSFDRLGQFLLAHEGADIAAIVVQHSPNDPTDNLTKLGYHLRRWKTQTKSKPRSAIHLVNLVGYLRETMGASPPPTGETDAERHPYLQDMLFAYDRHGRYVTLPGQVTIGESTLSLEGLSEADTDPELTLERESLTDRQRDFMRAAIDIINRLGMGWGVRVFHVSIYTTPDWYERELRAMIAASSGAATGAVVDLGTVPAKGSYHGPVLNPHGGGHFTHEFNAVWAREMMRRLREYGVP